MTTVKGLQLLGLILGITLLNIIILSHGLLGIEIGGESALETAFGVTLLVTSMLVLLYGIYTLFFKPTLLIPTKEIKTSDDYVAALSQYRHVKVLEDDISFALGQIGRMKKKKDTLLNVLNQRFDPNELSYKKFASVLIEVEKVFYLNARSILNRLSVFDESEYESVVKQNTSHFSMELLQEKTNLYNEYLTFVKSSLGTNEEILLKLDKLLLEISRLDSFEPGDIESMSCMQEIDSLIKQTKYYKQ